MSSTVAVVVGNFIPPAQVWRWPLVLCAFAALALALARRRRLWWLMAGTCTGLAACAFSARLPLALGERSIPVRFTVTIRDGWVESPQGFRTRAHLEQLKWRQAPLRHQREIELYVTGSATLSELPGAGTRWQGSGELAGDVHMPLAGGALKVKSLLLLQPLPVGSWLDGLRDRGVRALQRAAGVSPRLLRAAGLASALMLGRREELQEGEVRSLRRSGMAHLLAVAGLHVGLVAGFVWLVLFGLGVGPRGRRWLVAVAVFAFALLSGGNAPVRRAATGTIAYLLARQLGRPLVPLPTTWAVVAALTVLEPAAVLEPGFQLSAFVTLALVRWVGPVQRRLASLPRGLASALAVALVAQCASMPLVGQHFVAVAPLGVVANLAAMPLAFVLVAASVVALGLAGWWSFASAALLQVVAATQWTLDGVSRLGGLGSVPFPPLVAVLAGVLGALAVVALTRTRWSAGAALAAVGITAAWLVAPLPRLFPHELRALAVSDGMAVLARSGAGAVLVDAGRAPMEAWRELARARVCRLDALVITHPDVDHTGGATVLLERAHIGVLMYPLVLAERRELGTLRRLARERGIPEWPLAAGQLVRIGDATCEVLWPPARPTSADNNASLVMRVALGEIRLLITGDLEAAGEAALLATGAAMRSDILQLPHHGSRTSSTASFLRAVGPVLAVAATGVRPRFAYPDRAVAERVRRLPSVLVSQPGTVSVGWETGGPLVLAGGDGVRVHPRQGCERE
jgi:competence protein ComEC